MNVAKEKHVHPILPLPSMQKQRRRTPYHRHIFHVGLCSSQIEACPIIISHTKYVNKLEKLVSFPLLLLPPHSYHAFRSSRKLHPLPTLPNTQKQKRSTSFHNTPTTYLEAAENHIHCQRYQIRKSKREEFPSTGFLPQKRQIITSTANTEKMKREVLPFTTILPCIQRWQKITTTANSTKYVEANEKDFPPPHSYLRSGRKAHPLPIPQNTQNQKRITSLQPPYFHYIYLVGVVVDGRASMLLLHALQGCQRRDVCNCFYIRGGLAVKEHASLLFVL